MLPNPPLLLFDIGLELRDDEDNAATRESFDGVRVTLDGSLGWTRVRFKRAVSDSIKLDERFSGDFFNPLILA